MPRGNSKAGAAVGKLRSDGYKRVWVDGVHALVHRVVWKMHTGEEPPKYLDHINGVRDDNRFENLREADHSKNMWNSAERKTTNGLIGIRWHEYYGQRGGWVATITANNKSIRVGKFDSLREALVEYKKAVTLHHGEYGERKIEHNRRLARSMGIEI